MKTPTCPHCQTPMQAIAAAPLSGSLAILLECEYWHQSVKWLPRSRFVEIPKREGQRWMIGDKPVDLYELYAVWLSSPSVQAKYPKFRPSNVTPLMVLEYLSDKAFKRGPFKPRKRANIERMVL